jgi:hypothetical protein
MEIRIGEISLGVEMGSARCGFTLLDLDSSRQQRVRAACLFATPTRSAGSHGRSTRPLSCWGCGAKRTGFGPSPRHHAARRTRRVGMFLVLETCASDFLGRRCFLGRTPLSGDTSSCIVVRLSFRR